MNPITLYLSHKLVPYEEISLSLLGGPLAAACGPWGPLLLACGPVLLALALARFLYARNLFLRV